MTNLTDQTKEHLQNHHMNFEKFAQVMIDTHQGRFDEIFWANIAKHCTETPELIVDLGTGPGLLLNDLRTLYPSTTLIGVEAQPVMIQEAKKILDSSKLDNYELINHDLVLPNIENIKDNSTDMVICSMVIHELQVPTVIINEMSRILKPGGVAIIYDWHRHSLEKYSGDTSPSTLEEFTHFSEHCRYSEDDLIFLFERSGLSTIESMVRKRGKHVLLTVKKTH